MSKIRCEICDKTFKDESGLAQHTLAKHSSKEQEKKPKNYRMLRNWAIIIGIFGAVILLLWWGFSSLSQESKACKTDPVSEINIGSHENLALHVHSDLKIIIDSKQQIIPSNIGVLPGILRPVHTHDATGEIHMEGKCPREYSLGEFFELWGRTFDKECIFDRCTTNGTLTMSVNGKENAEFQNYIMHDKDEILITYTSEKPLQK